MNRNLDDKGFFFKRHLYRKAGLEPSYEEILGLLHTVAENKGGMDQLILIKDMYKLVEDSPSSLKVFQNDESVFEANILIYRSKGVYEVLYDKSAALVAVKIITDEFSKATRNCYHDIYLEGAFPSGAAEFIL